MCSQRLDDLDKKRLQLHEHSTASIEGEALTGRQTARMNTGPSLVFRNSHLRCVGLCTTLQALKLEQNQWPAHWITRVFGPYGALVVSTREAESHAIALSSIAVDCKEQDARFYLRANDLTYDPTNQIWKTPAWTGCPSPMLDLEPPSFASGLSGHGILEFETQFSLRHSLMKRVWGESALQFTCRPLEQRSDDGEWGWWWTCPRSVEWWMPLSSCPSGVQSQIHLAANGRAIKFVS